MKNNQGDTEKSDGIPPFDINSFVVQNSSYELRFARSAGKHRISRESVRKVISNAAVVAKMGKGAKGDDQIIFLGDDATGAPIEVMAVELETHLLVIHAMPLRDKWRHLYRFGKSDE